MTDGEQRPRLLLIGGGVRAGKSRWALSRAQALGTRRVFLATADAGDGEMAARIAAHRAERGDAFETREVPHALAETLVGLDAGVEVVVIDCLTLWLSNRLLALGSAAAVERELPALLDALSRPGRTSIVVTNEVGMGIVPESALGREFRDLAGRAHQALAARADEVCFAVMGMVLRLKPAPVAVIG